MSDTRIEWATKVWNPVTGCTKVSTGCKNCYAERMATRLAGRCGYPEEHPFAVTLHPERLDDPLHWRKPERVFVNSMSDLFHEDVPREFVKIVLQTIGDCPHHAFMVLTKRPQNIERMLYGWCDEFPARSQAQFLGGGDYLPNLWLGVSVEDQATADERIPLLLQTPAAVRFVSCEPLLGPVRLDSPTTFCHYSGRIEGADCGHVECRDRTWLSGIGWVITGGESGPRARPSHPDWFRSVRDQCVAADVPFFFKQWGEWAEHPGDCEDIVHDIRSGAGNVALVEKNPDKHYETLMDLFGMGRYMLRVGKRAAGHLLDGREHREFPRALDGEVR